MADYFAVLSRTLAGFGEPKPELREKLYERARMTIRKQLDSHVPALDEPALAAEMSKLEKAILEVESGFGPPNVNLEPATPERAPAPDTKEKPQKPGAKPDKKAKAVEKSKVDEKAKEPEKVAETKKPEPVSEESKATPAKEKKGFLKRKAKKKEPAPEKTSQDKPALKPKSDTSKNDAAAKSAKPGESVEDQPASATEADVASASVAAAIVTSDSEPKKTPVPESATTDVKQPSQDETVDPMDEWAREFLNAQEASKPEVAEALAEIQADRVKSVEEDKAKTDERAATIAAAATAAATTPVKAEAPAPDLPVFDKKPDKTLVIPPAPKAAPGGRSGGLLKWLLIALLVFLCAGGAYLALNWENRAEIASQFGMDGLFGSDVTPTPVKTIKIAPPPEPESEPAPEPAPEAPAEPAPDTPKSEDRLTGDGVIEQPATPAPEAPAAPVAPATQPETRPETGETPQTGAETQQLPAADAGATPAVAQSAILYEEGGSAAENSFDTGRVVWSTVEEQGGEGEGKVPAIRARVEVPSRQLVLIMTIKRNSDRALPASHLIELVFAVPDDFNGGSIQEVSRFVLKESEQDRGQALIGVPARISDGIFLIALNNLESAQNTNEQLLRGRSWVDIPMQYRTGRRALITLEKGLPGNAVFKEVFEAWDRLKNQP